ncbi:MAG: hypothetical protein II494_06485 [Bacilli bacterium]|nr:hypothetical protein [Bacilli bacterium]
MKGKHILFLAIPAMMLASCGGNLGTEVTDSSAINDMLSNVATKSEDVKNFKFVVDMNGTSYDKEAKKTVTSKAHIVYERNEDEEVHCKTESEEDKLKEDIDFYLVKNTTYQQVMYVDTYEDEDKTDSKNGEHTITCIGYEGHELDFAFGAMYTIVPSMLLSMVMDPTSYVSSVADQEEQTATIKYYTSGDKLTVTVNVVPKELESIKKSDDENSVSSTMEVHYVKNVFTDGVVESTSNKGNKQKYTMKLEQKSKFAINLPSGWETKINQEADA